MTYAQLCRALETLGYCLASLLPEEIEAIGKAEGFKKHRNGRYYFNLY